MQPRPVRWSAAVLTGVAVVLVDQASKAWIDRSAVLVQARVRNPGTLTGAQVASPPVLILAALCTLGVFLAVIGRWALRSGIPPTIPALVVGGLLGNVLDRARYGAVRDFIHTPWLIINLADIAVTAGLVALGAVAALRHGGLRSALVAQQPTEDLARG